MSPAEQLRMFASMPTLNSPSPVLVLLRKSDACACGTTKNDVVAHRVVFGTATESVHLPKSVRACLLA